jgi:ribosomal protein L37E
MKLDEQIKKIIHSTMVDKEWLIMTNIGFNEKGELVHKVGEHYDEFESLTKELSTLIQKEREEVLYSFGEWLEDNHTEYGYIAMAQIVDDYLSQTKGENKFRYRCERCGRSFSFKFDEEKVACPFCPPTAVAWKEQTKGEIK